MGPRLQAIAEGFEADAFNYLLFLRLVPLFPFWLVNLAPALTPVKARTFWAATLVGIVPGTFVYANLGARWRGSTRRATLWGAPRLAALALLGALSLVPILVRRLRTRKAAAWLTSWTSSGPRAAPTRWRSWRLLLGAAGLLLLFLAGPGSALRLVALPHRLPAPDVGRVPGDRRRGAGAVARPGPGAAAGTGGGASWRWCWGHSRSFLPWSWRREARGYPPIHDVTTDVANPPAFVAVLPLRADAPNPPEYPGDSVAALQREAYPDIAPLMMAMPVDSAFSLAAAVAREMSGWRAGGPGPPPGPHRGHRDHPLVRLPRRRGDPCHLGVRDLAGGRALQVAGGARRRGSEREAGPRLPGGAARRTAEPRAVPRLS
jgi:hypothetical protein